MRQFGALIIALMILGALSPMVSADELTVSAAVSLKDAFAEIGRQFHDRHPRDQVVFNFGASGELAQQIDRGAPVDVFASAAMDQLMRLESKGFVDRNSAMPFAANRLVVVIPAGGTKLLRLTDLLNLKLIAVGNPQTVPAGAYARQALTKEGIYGRLQAEKKLVFAETVRQTLDYVENGNVDAGLVYVTDARVGRNIATAFTVPESYTEPIVYPIAIVSDSKHKALAREFLQFVLGKEGQAVLQSKGFLPAGK